GAAEPCAQCFALHAGKARRFVTRGEPVHMILPAFPAKSPSPKKTLGPMPDLAERVALESLGRLIEEIRAIHAPGARITICSDGHVFSDLVLVDDGDVTRYGREIEAMIDRLGLRSIDTFS